jgi:membrane carboxypeptidase/penicillin-binding protein PbpC
MNARLQRLIDQSFTDHQGEQFDPERFARLIVKECADLYNHEDVLAPIGMSAHGEAHQHGWIEGTKTYRDTILEHFGIDS